MSEHRFLLVAEVAKILRVQPETVLKKIRAGVIKAQMTGKRYLVTRRDLDIYISKFPWRNPKLKGEANGQTGGGCG